jgi:hypothetical protein
MNPQTLRTRLIEVQAKYPRHEPVYLILVDEDNDRKHLTRVRAYLEDNTYDLIFDGGEPITLTKLLEWTPADSRFLAEDHVSEVLEEIEYPGRFINILLTVEYA